MQPKGNKDSYNKKIYQTHTFNNNTVELKRISFELFHVSVARFSGPIAMYLNKQIHSQNSYSTEQSDYILMFSNKGTVFNKIPFFVKDRIIFFQFLHDEVLMVGTPISYYLIDPFRSSVRMIDLSQNFKSTKVMGYKVVGLFIYAIVGNRVFEIRNIYQPVPKEIAFLNINLLNPVIIFEKNPGIEDPQIIYLHERSEIYSSMTGNQIIQCKPLTDPKTKLMFLNKWIDKQKNVYYILVFHNPLKIGYYFNGTSTFYQPPDLKTIEQQPPVQNRENRHNYGHCTNKGYSCAWIQDTAFVSNKIWTVRLNSKGMNVLKNERALIGQQIDGVRLIGYSNQIMRLVPVEYLSLFKDSKNTSILQLYSAFQEYQNSTVVNIQVFETNVRHKQQNLDTIIKAAEFALDSIQQMRILKFGIFLKTYYCMSTNLNELCQDLRLINNLRYEAVNRCLTLQQFRHLKANQLDQFVSVLLRYNLHFIADIIGGGQKVYYHWAKCKIEKESQDAALNSIIKKFDFYKEKKSRELSYVDIARYAIETKRFQLAQNLIEHETNLKRKVMILLWMASLKRQVGFLQKALDNAEKSMDSDTINRVIFEIQNSNKDYATSQNINRLLQKRIILKNHYIQYLKYKNPNKLKDYYLKKKQNNELGLLALRSYEGQKYKTPQSFQLVKKLLPSVLESQTTPKSSEYPLFLRRALNQNYEISQAEIQKYQKEKNPEFLAELLIQREMLDQAVGVIIGLESELAFNLLFKIERWKQAVALARERKNIEILNKLLEIAPNGYREEIVTALNYVNSK